MVEQIKSMTDLAKFFIMLLLYTGYMTWWASGVSHDIKNQQKKLENHIIADNIITQETIKLAQQVLEIEEHQQQNSSILSENIKQHAKCTAIMEAVLKRLERLEASDKVPKYNGGYPWK